MKKLLALVLALVMTLSLCVTSNAAYADAADVDYTEAVDVMSAVGVFQGADGKFSPKAELTREQAAKLIAYLDLGEKVAEALPAVKVFNDVEANRWSAKYVAYCADAGYINGVGDGNFDPAGKLTGYAFGKMLLCVLGYDATIEGFTGANWQIAVAKLMQSNDIAKSVDASSSATLTREAAAQYCLNALKANKVAYASKGTNITINGAVIATGASKASADEYDKPNKTLAAVLYGSKLDKSTGTDDFGRKATTWTYNSKKVGSYTTEEPILTYTDSLKEKDLFTDLGVDGISGKNAKYIVLDEIWVDGTKVATSKESSTKGQYEAESSSNASYADTVVIAKGDSSNMAGPGKGVKTEIFAIKNKNGDAVANHYKMVCTKEYLTQVTSVTKANATTGAKRYVTTALGNFETEDFAKKDWVVVTKGNDGIATMVAATKVEDVAVTSYTSSKVTAGGTTYKYSQEFSGTKGDFELTAGNTYTFYLDSCGNILKFEKFSSTNTNYVFVQAVSTVQTGDFIGDDHYYSYKLLAMDGKVTTVKALADSSNKATAAKNTIVTYKDDADNEGYVVFTTPGAYLNEDTHKSTAGFTNATLDTANGFKKSTSTYGKVVLNNNTTFVLTTAKNTYKVVKGLSAMDNYALTANKILYTIQKNGAAVVAFLDLTSDASASSDADDLVYVVSTSYTKSYDSANKDYVYAYSAIVNGEKDTVKVIGTSDTAPSVSVGLMKITATQDGYAKTLEAAKTGKYSVVSTLASAAGEVSYESGVLTIGGTGYVVNDAAEVFTILGDDNEVTADAALEALVGDSVKGTFYFIAKSDNDATIATIYFDGTIG